MAGGSGNKKHKRGSIPSSTSGTPRIEIFERTPENDYGVLSDPDENTPTTIPMMDTQEQSTAQEQQEQEQPTAQAEHQQHQPPTIEESHALAEGSRIPTEQSPHSHSPQDSQPSSQSSSQQQSPSLQPQISPIPTLSKSLNTLQLKLSRDKNFSKKITLHTFFSYIILAIEIQRSCSASIAHISAQQVEELVEYMIQHHSASGATQSYLQTLGETGVIKNIIESIIEFNKDQTAALDKFLTIELEMDAIKDENAAADATSTAIPVTILSSDTATSQNTPQTPQRRGFFKRMRCFFSGCCG
jgi:hypothetical protein